jgi:hypothetical protein
MIFFWSIFRLFNYNSCESAYKFHVELNTALRICIQERLWQIADQYEVDWHLWNNPRFLERGISEPFSVSSRQPQPRLEIDIMRTSNQR